MSKLSEYLAQKGLTINEAQVTARQGIMDYLTQARIDNKAYLALEAPTASERNAQIVKLTRQNIRIMRLLMNQVVGED